MDGRRGLLASLVAVGALAAGCGGPRAVPPTIDIDTPDAAHDGPADNGVPDTSITSGLVGTVPPARR